MTSVLQGGRRRRRPNARLLRLLVLLAPVAVAIATLAGFNHDGSTGRAETTPAQSEQTPGGTPSPGTAAPDPAQAALAGVDAFRVPFKAPPGAGIVFDVESGEVLWRRSPLKRVPIASLTKVMTALLVVENTTPG